jgi:hypothetical protein
LGIAIRFRASLGLSKRERERERERDGLLNKGTWMHVNHGVCIKEEINESSRVHRSCDFFFGEAKQSLQ